MKKTNDLGNDKIFALVLRLAIPAMLAQLVNVLYTVVDRIFIGNIPLVGDIALAGVGVCAPIAEFLASWGNLIGIGGSVYMAMKMGEGDNGKAERILSNCFAALIAMSVVLTVIFMLAKGHLINWFGASAETFPYANNYLTIYIAGSIFAIMTIGMNYFITCQGFPGVAMVSVVTGAVTNIILDYVLVFVVNMGVAGAALATVIAQAVSCTITLWFLFGERIHIKIKKHAIENKILKKVCKLGFSAFVMYSTNSVIVIILNTVLQNYGGAEMGDTLISASTIVQSYGLAILNPLGGITAGTGAIISYNYGAKNFGRVVEAFNKVSLVAVIFCVFMTFISFFVPGQIVELFTQDPEVARIAVWGMRTYSLGVGVLALHYEITDGLTAMGRPNTALAMSAFRKISFVVMMCVIPLFMSPEKVFYYEPAADIVCGLINVALGFVIMKKIIVKESVKLEKNKLP